MHQHLLCHSLVREQFYHQYEKRIIKFFLSSHVSGKIVTMKAVITKSKGSFDNVVVEEIAKPSHTTDEILVKVCAAGVNPVDWKAVLSGYFGYPLILGSDIAG